MLVVLIRHAQSMNNYWETIKPEVYDELRIEDPEISQKGVGEVALLGEFLKNREITFDKCIFTHLFILSLFQSPSSSSDVHKSSFREIRKSANTNRNNTSNTRIWWL